MPQDQVSVTTSTSWFSRLGSALKGVLAGFALVLGAIILLGWNEGRSIQSIRSNNEGARSVVSVAPDRVQATNEGKLVHVSAPAAAMGDRQDSQLGIAAGGLVLARHVEHFQWVETSTSETRTKLGGGQETLTTYSYKTEWSATPQDSSGFNQPQGHQNPVVALKDTVVLADNASVGAFLVDRTALEQVSADTSLPLGAAQAQNVSTALSRPATAADNIIYVGTDPQAPQVGDMKISYRVIPQNTILSVIGAQSGNNLRAYPTKAGNSILMVRTGTATAAEMFNAAKAANKTMTWVLRGVGLAMAIAAFGLILGPLGVLGDVVPLIGTIVRTGTGFVAGVLGVALALVVIAVSWIAFRPLLGIALLVVVAALAGGAFVLSRKKAGTAQALK